MAHTTRLNPVNKRNRDVTPVNLGVGNVGRFALAQKQMALKERASRSELGKVC